MFSSSFVSFVNFTIFVLVPPQRIPAGMLPLDDHTILSAKSLEFNIAQVENRSWQTASMSLDSPGKGPVGQSAWSGGGGDHWG
jgi:hypothetical protein